MKPSDYIRLTSDESHEVADDVIDWMVDHDIDAQIMLDFVAWLADRLEPYHEDER